MAVSGSYAYANYGYEASYGNGAVSNRTFGHGVKFTASNKNNLTKLYGLGSRNATAIAAGKFEGSGSIEFVLSNASFFRAILGQVTDAGSGPYTHTYTEANTIPSFAIDAGVELGASDAVFEYKGCKVSSATLTATVGEPVKVRLECFYKTFSLATSGIGSQIIDSEDVFTFAQGTVELPSGNVIACIQSFELTINNNLEMVWCLGDRTAVAGVEKIRDYEIRMTANFTDVSKLLTKFLGNSSGPSSGTPAETATLKLTFTNGLSGTNERSIVITLANVSFDEETLPLDVNEVIKEDVTGFARSCTSVVWTNNTAVDAGTP